MVIGFLTPLVRLIILCKKVRPGQITLHAKFRVPISDWSSCRVVDRLDRNSLKVVLIRWILSSGSLASIACESRIFPMNWISLQWPSVLAAEMGMLRFLKDNIMLDILTWQRELKGAVGAGGSIIRKSSKMWHTKEIAQLFYNIHSYPLNCVRKLIEIKWGRTEPKGEHFIKMVRPTPKHAQKFPIMRMNRKEPKCWFYVGLATKQSEPNLCIAEIALSIVMYWREKSSLSIKWFILVVPVLGKDRWNIVRNLSEYFFGTRPIGETWKFSNWGKGRDP